VRPPGCSGPEDQQLNVRSTNSDCLEKTFQKTLSSVVSKLKCPVLLASEMSGFFLFVFNYLSSSSGCGNVGKSGRFLA
jgi:hypothetical protein